MSAPSRGGHPQGVLYYRNLCLLSLGVVFVADLQKESVLTSLLIVATGVLGLMVRLKTAPLLLLMVLSVSQLFRQASVVGAWNYSGLKADEVLLCAGVLGFVAGYYRMNGLVGHILPADPRLAGLGPQTWRSWLGTDVRQLLRDLRTSRGGPVRAPGLVTRAEISALVLSLPAWALAAQAVLAFLGQRWPGVERILPLHLWRFCLLFWLLAVGGLLVRAAFDQWQRRKMPAAAAAVFLQDIAWQETRREQRRVQRWLAWGRLRRWR